jgi:hypothetical protein
MDDTLADDNPRLKEQFLPAGRRGNRHGLRGRTTGSGRGDSGVSLRETVIFSPLPAPNDFEPITRDGLHGPQGGSRSA